MNEFELIRAYFAPLGSMKPSHGGVGSAETCLGIGDDAALLRVAEGHELVTSVDTLVEGRHFFSDVDPVALGHKSMAVNLSDMAAMGADPRWVLLSITLPEAKQDWIQAFASGMGALLHEHGVALVGGDTCKGALTISVTILGQVPSGQALLRSGAKAGDGVYVTGALGDARAVLNSMQGVKGLNTEELVNLRSRLEMPTPRVSTGAALRGLASAAIDLSDGLSGDLQHVLTASGVGARVALSDLPVSRALSKAIGGQEAQKMAWLGGDDYELCFTAPAENTAEVMACVDKTGVQITRIGTVVDEPGLVLLDESGNPLQSSQIAAGSFRHF